MIYVTSDLHGYPLEKFKALLEKAEFSDDDFCFVLGDVIDRGTDGIKTLRWLMAQPNFELVLGNHESMMLGCDFICEDITDESIAELKVNGIIRTCPKMSLFAAFRSFGIERRQPSCNLNNQKSSENPSLSGRRIFTVRIFGQSRHKTQQILSDLRVF